MKFITVHEGKRRAEPRDDGTEIDIDSIVFIRDDEKCTVLQLVGPITLQVVETAASIKGLIRQAEEREDGQDV